MVVRATMALLAASLLACSGNPQSNNIATTPDNNGATTTAPEPTPKPWNDGYGDAIGTVRFKTSCNAEADRYFGRGLALLHHMTYNGAAGVFDSAIEADPDCAIAYWGRAMPIIHPVWPDQPSDELLKQGWELIQTAKQKSKANAVEKAWIAAVEGHLRDGSQRTKAERIHAFYEGWKKAHEQFPDDLETTAFYALALIGSAKPTDKTYVQQKEAAELARKILEQIPDHPGGHHYLIHALDYPSLAAGALEAAHNYGKIAPDVAHALHMPSHIFTRVGHWHDSIEWNIRSRRAGLAHPIDGHVSHHYFHAVDYLVYAYLQTSQDKKALQAVEDMKQLTDPFLPHPGSAYALAASEARYFVETRQWDGAAALAGRWPEQGFPWEKFSQFESIRHFARAMGAAHTKKFDLAKQEIATMNKLKAATKIPYWTKTIDVEIMSAEAWMFYLQGKKQKALKKMQAAADLESTYGKHPITPSELLPASELLGEMLLEMKQPAEALKAFEQALQRSPNRFHSLAGAARAAASADVAKAKKYYQALLELGAKAEGERPELAEAKKFLAGK